MLPSKNAAAWFTQSFLAPWSLHSTPNPKVKPTMRRRLCRGRAKNPSWRATHATSTSRTLFFPPELECASSFPASLSSSKDHRNSPPRLQTYAYILNVQYGCPARAGFFANCYVCHGEKCCFVVVSTASSNPFFRRLRYRPIRFPRLDNGCRALLSTDL